MLKVLTVLLPIGALISGYAVLRLQPNGGDACMFRCALPLLGGSGALAVLVFFRHAKHQSHWGKLVFCLLLAYSSVASLLTVIVARCISATASSGDGKFWVALVLQLAALHLPVFVHAARLAAPRMPSKIYVGLVQVPATLHFTGCGLSWLFLPLLAKVPAAPQWLPVLVLPFVLALAGVAQSFYQSPWELVTIPAPTVCSPLAAAATWPATVVRSARRNTRNTSRPRRVGVTRKPFNTEGQSLTVNTSLENNNGSGKFLRIVQITDPHLGGYMSIQKLREICEYTAQIVRPDLVLLTGDFFTPEAHETPGLLTAALEPLLARNAKWLEGKVFACLGNHDKEEPRVLQTVTSELEALGVTLLVDRDITVKIRGAVVHITGLDYIERNREQEVVRVMQRCPPPEEADFRIVLLHDPKCFQYIPSDRYSVVFSGHTHGGQIGLLSLGLNTTAFGVITRQPDHGLWEYGTNLCYVHRGQGFRSPLCNAVARLGVLNENSVVCLTKKP
eukprot:TRINITY_DN4571_c0_g1_i1.p1 TRINITY_DN4571_c0_g1~~TRINITY_DN4571_c0_g1_i1.p1  ORF type:complete len:504 (+),score=56.41 TRINITY_DN4571_c0_g1_i1:241-1752(+)